MTAYCPCVRCTGRWSGGPTASGWMPDQGTTVAADRARYPLGTCLEIEGLGRRIVQDVGSAIRGRRLDVFYYSHADALRFGRREMRVRRCSL